MMMMMMMTMMCHFGLRLIGDIKKTVGP